MKKLLALVMVTCMVFGLVACGAPASQPAAAEPAAPAAAAPAAEAPAAAPAQADAPKPYDGVTLRVILASHDWTSAMQSEIPKFEAATGMKVEYEVYPEGQLSDKLNVELGSGGQYIDVFMCRPLQEVQQFIKNGFLAPVDDPRPGSAGKCCNGFGGMEAKVSPDGELLLRGPAVLKGYYKEPTRTADVLDADGWFRTGDIGRIDEDGYVWITGRASRTIVLSSGKKVAPEELEEKILSIPGIHEAVVYGDGAIREIVAEVYAVVSEDTVKRQIDSLNRQLPVHKRIKRVIPRKEPFPLPSVRLPHRMRIWFRAARPAFCILLLPNIQRNRKTERRKLREHRQYVSKTDLPCRTPRR